MDLDFILRSLLILNFVFVGITILHALWTWQTRLPQFTGAWVFLALLLSSLGCLLYWFCREPLEKGWLDRMYPPSSKDKKTSDDTNS